MAQTRPAIPEPRLAALTAVSPGADGGYGARFAPAQSHIADIRNATEVIAADSYFTWAIGVFSILKDNYSVVKSSSGR